MNAVGSLKIVDQGWLLAERKPISSIWTLKIPPIWYRPHKLRFWYFTWQIRIVVDGCLNTCKDLMMYRLSNVELSGFNYQFQL